MFVDNSPELGLLRRRELQSRTGFQYSASSEKAILLSSMTASTGHDLPPTNEADNDER